MGPFDRFNDRAKRVLALAQDEAIRFNHNYIGTEHLLLGLVREREGIASGVLESFGVPLEQVRKQVIATLDQQPRPTGAGMVVERAPDSRGSLTDAQGQKRDWYCEDVLSGKLKVHVIHEDDLVLAFEHPYPEYVAHAVVIPKRHVASLMVDDAADPTLLAAMIRAVQAVARSIGLHEQGFRLEANAGAPGVTPHMHWHVVGPGLPPPRRDARGAAAGAPTRIASGPATYSAAGPFGRFNDERSGCSRRPRTRLSGCSTLGSGPSISCSG